MLSGAISFNREAFLRIDMYALGLICWEIAMRTDTGEGGCKYVCEYDGDGEGEGEGEGDGESVCV